MKPGELITRLTVWFALGAYAVGVVLLRLAKTNPSRLRDARLWWTLGCAFFIAHVVCAFTFFHGWSHAAAYRDTAQQTAAMTGIHWGGGLYFNYLFAAAWLVDVLWWWIAPDRFARRPKWLTIAWHAFFFFMVLNGAVVFAHGPMRWLGALLCAGPLAVWLLTRERHLPTKN